MTNLQYFSFLASVILTLVAIEYFKNKGKNMATKEDIGKITAIAEGIKSELANKTELLKAQLSLVNTHKLNMKNAEREALFEYNKKNAAWLYSIAGVKLDNYSADNPDELEEVRKDFRRKKYDLDIAAEHLSLFDSDNEFRDLKKDMTVATVAYHDMVEKVIRDAKMRFKMSKRKMKGAKLDEELAIIKQYSKETSKLSNKLDKDGLELYKEIKNLHTQIAAKIIERLKQIEEQEDIA